MCVYMLNTAWKKEANNAHSLRGVVDSSNMGAIMPLIKHVKFFLPFFGSRSEVGFLRGARGE